jgi:serine/threonine-protein kinase
VVSAASDLYSIGIILYELLTARAPFEADTVPAILLKHLRDRPTPPSACGAAVSSELDAIVMRALEKNPGSRFADAGSFSSALECARRGLTARGSVDPPMWRNNLSVVNRSERAPETRRWTVEEMRDAAA